jgi:hypothetical protein
MRRALRQNSPLSQPAIARSIPAPVGGWNTEDALADMAITDAVILDNWIPRGGRCEMRRGHIDQATGTAQPVQTLITYSGGTGDQLFACAGANIFDVTDAGALPSASYASAASAKWNWINFANDGGRFALLANGEQGPIKYDGSAFSSNTIEGSAASGSLVEANLKYVMAHKSRVHWGEKEALRVWFLGVNEIASLTAELLDLGGLFSSGGHLVGMATWSRDNGSGGLDDLAVYVTSEGQAAVYAGSDPGDLNDWAMVGVFDFAKPVGERPLLKDGGEICIVTEEGLLPLSILVATKRTDQKSQMLSRKVATAFSDAAASYGTLFGWQAIYYSGRGGLIMINVPTEEGVSALQYVRSAQNSAWARFTGLPAICWGVANGMIYFGGTAGVYRWDIGSSDNSEPIVPDVLPAFSSYGNRAAIKQFTMMRALIYAPSIVQPAMDMVYEYDTATLPTSVPTTITPGDISPDDDKVIRNAWTGAAGEGYVASPRTRFTLTGSDDVDVVAVTEDHTELLLVGPGGTDNVLTRPNLPLDVSVQLVGWDVMFLPGGQL